MTINAPGRDSAGVLHLRGAVRGRGARPTPRHAAERHSQGVSRAERIRVSARPECLSWSSTRSNTARSTCRSGTRSASAVYHIREAGATAPQELAFTIADGMCYTEESIKRGLDVDAFAPR